MTQTCKRAGRPARRAPESEPALQLIREKYWEYGYEEVVTPNLFNFELWERSGHAEHYKDNMFLVDIEDQEFGLKPMNCPGFSPVPHQSMTP